MSAGLSFVLLVGFSLEALPFVELNLFFDLIFSTSLSSRVLMVVSDGKVL